MHKSIGVLLLVALALTACGVAPQEAISSAPPSSAPSVTAAPATAAATTTVTLVPTTAATSSATIVPATASATPTLAAATATTAASATPTTASASATPTTNATATSEPSATASVSQATATALPTGTATGALRGTIAFERGGSIYAYRPETDALAVLIEDGRDIQFSRDGAQLAFVRDDGLYLAAADGSNIRRIVAQSEIAAPRWADDGSKLLFERGKYGPAPGYSEIWTIELPAGEPVKIAEGNDPAWAPDSKRIAYVTPNPLTETAVPRRNELHLTNWRGQNDWPVVRNVPANTPPTGVPDIEIPAAQLEHLLFAPTWSADGSAIYALARAASQIETDFILWERADPINGGATYLETLIDARDVVAAPDRRGVVVTVSTARGDISLYGRPLDPALSRDAYEWVTARSPQQTTYQHIAPAWSPDSNALATIRCADMGPDQTDCALVLLAPGQSEPEVLIADVFEGQPLDYIALPTMSWGR